LWGIDAAPLRSCYNRTGTADHRRGAAAVKPSRLSGLQKRPAFAPPGTELDHGRGDFMDSTNHPAAWPGVPAAFPRESAMLCSRCRQIPKESAPPRDREAGPQSFPGWDRLKLIMCSGCGELLPVMPHPADLLDRLAGLARFGLAAGTSTILEP
jgi:hypothetical protein